MNGLQSTWTKTQLSFGMRNRGSERQQAKETNDIFQYFQNFIASPKRIKAVIKNSEGKLLNIEFRDILFIHTKAANVLFACL